MRRLITLWKKWTSGKPAPEEGTATHDPTDDAVNQNRRRLIKGAATTPMILTLYNGAALARSSIVVTEAMNYDELFDTEKMIDRPICVTAERFDPVGGIETNDYHVYNGTADFMECVTDQEYQDYLAQTTETLTDTTEVTDLTDTSACYVPQDDTQKTSLFDIYNGRCETDQGGLLIVASSSASLIH